MIGTLTERAVSDRDGGDHVSNDAGGDKTENATPKRMKQLRKDGSLAALAGLVGMGGHRGGDAHACRS